MLFLLHQHDHDGGHRHHVHGQSVRGWSLHVLLAVALRTPFFIKWILFLLGFKRIYFCKILFSLQIKSIHEFFFNVTTILLKLSMRSLFSIGRLTELSLKCSFKLWGYPSEYGIKGSEGVSVFIIFQDIKALWKLFSYFSSWFLLAALETILV